jgi:hypothetical protein
MTTWHKVTIVLAVCFALFCVLAGYGLYREHDARVRLEAQTEAHKQAEAQTLADIKQIRDTLASQTAQNQALKASVQTPAQVVKAIPQFITLPAPVIQVSKEQAAATASLPDAPQQGDLIVPQQDAKQLFDYGVQCKQCSDDLAAVKQTSADKDKLLADKDGEINDLNAALKGGTKWQRVKGAAKDLLCGSGGAGGGAVIDRGQPARGAFIGAAIGILGCKLF